MSEPSTRALPARRLVHPLCGADLGTLAKLTGRARGCDLGGWGRLALCWAAAAGRAPVQALESMTVGRNAAAATPRTPPLFILGHWRSGTTHLYNILAHAPAFSYVSPLATGLPWDFILLERFFGPLLRSTLPSDRFIDRIPVHAEAPQEDEIGIASMQTISFYHALYFPQRFEEELRRGLFLDGVSQRELDRWRRALRRMVVKIERTRPGRRLVVKNPVYTARVAELARLFPDARFIHIYRDPRRVFPSMRHFYSVLFRQLGLGPSDHVNVDEVILSTYDEMMTRLYREADELEQRRLTHIRYEEFEQDPLTHIEAALDTLEIEGFDDGRASMSAYLEGVRSYKKNRFAHDPELEELLQRRIGHWLTRLGYKTHPAETAALAS